MINWRNLKTLFLKKGRPTKLLIILLPCIIVYYSILKIDFRWYLITDFHINGSSVTPQDLEPFQPEVFDDFPTVSGDEPRIPHIIHQTSNTTLIPNEFVKKMKSFIEKNPTWTYYFWTDESARKLIKDRHPNLLDIWNSYRKPVSRVDALKYIVLYEFGGIYVDIDFDCLRPLNRVTMKYACIFPPEPFEHSAFQNGIPYLIGNSIIMCRPKHPFLKLMITKLAQSAAFIEQRDSTGPAFVTFNFLAYNKITDMFKVKANQESNSPYFYKGELLEDDINAVYVPNTVYFMDTLKTLNWKKNIYYHKCRNFDTQPSIVRRACFLLSKKGFDRHETKYSFTFHHWCQTYIYKNSLFDMFYTFIFGPRVTDVSEIVPHYKMYPNNIG